MVHGGFWLIDLILGGSWSTGSLLLTSGLNRPGNREGGGWV